MRPITALDGLNDVFLAQGCCLLKFDYINLDLGSVPQKPGFYSPEKGFCVCNEMYSAVAAESEGQSNTHFEEHLPA